METGDRTDIFNKELIPINQEPPGEKADTERILEQNRVD